MRVSNVWESFLLFLTPFARALNKIDSSCPLTIYGPCTSNTPLRSHIYKVHIDLYLQESERQQWPIGIHAVGDCLNEGWTFAQMQEQLKDPTCSIETLGPPPNPRGGGSLPGVGKSASLDRDLPDFSIEEMHRQIVKFIVADDQVSTVYFLCTLVNHHL